MTTAAQLFEHVKIWLTNEVPPAERFLRLVQLRYTYFLTHDQLCALLEHFRTDVVTADADKVYREALPWFRQYCNVETFEDFVDSTSPLVWDYDTLFEGVGDWKEKLYEEVTSLFVTNEDADYSAGVPLAAVPGHYVVDWLEERGFIRLGDSGVMLSRSIQPVVMQVGAVSQLSERTMLVLPSMDNDSISEVLPIIPGSAGGVAFRAVFEAKLLNLPVADHLFIDHVTQVLVLRGVLDKNGDFTPVLGQEAYDTATVELVVNNEPRQVPLLTSA